MKTIDLWDMPAKCWPVVREALKGYVEDAVKVGDFSAAKSAIRTIEIGDEKIADLQEDEEQ